MFELYLSIHVLGPRLFWFQRIAEVFGPIAQLKVFTCVLPQYFVGLSLVYPLISLSSL
jgi:hypothetical protein